MSEVPVSLTATVDTIANLASQPLIIDWFKEALPYLNNGKRVFPCYEKAPRIVGWNRDSKNPTADEVELYFQKFADSTDGIGVCQGTASGNEYTLDFESDEVYHLFIDRLGTTPECVIKSGKGYHVPFVTDEALTMELRPVLARFADGRAKVELLAQNNNAIKPPSRHPSGRFYITLKGEPWNPPRVSKIEAERWLSICRSFNEFTPVAATADEIQKIVADFKASRDDSTGTESETDYKQLRHDFNSNNPIDTLLAKHGYTNTSGAFWKHPNNGCNSKSVHVLNDAISIHFSPNDPASQGGVKGNKDTRVYDAFALYVFFEYGDDITAAWHTLLESDKQKSEPITELWGGVNGPQVSVDVPTPDVAISITPPDDGLILIDYGTLKRKPIDWLWHRRIAVGKLSLICGDAGCGKSTISLDIAAHVSTGAPWPDSTEQRTPYSVILVSAEDDPEDTVGPRLDAAQADSRKIVGLKAQRFKEKSGKVVERYFSLDDIPMIEATLKRRNDFRLIIIDPISSYFGKANSHNDSEVSGLLAPLAQLAQNYHVAIILIAHPNKGNHSNAANKVGGSVALNAACRASYMTFKDKSDEGKRFMLPIKNNLGNDVDGLGYRIVEMEVESGKSSRIEWEGTTMLTADKWMIQNENKTVSKADSAKEWLRQKLVDNGPMLQTDIELSATELNISDYALKQAKVLLGIEPKRISFGGKWQWELPQAF